MVITENHWGGRRGGGGRGKRNECKKSFRKGVRGGKRGMKLFLNQVKERGWKGGRREIERNPKRERVSE